MKSKILMKRILTGTLALSVVMGASFCPVFAADNVGSLKTKQSTLANQQQKNSSDLASLRQNKSQKATYAAALQSQLGNIEEQVNNYNNQITDLDLQAQKAQTEIDATQKSIVQGTVKLKQRLCALYMGGDASRLQILLSSKGLIDLADKTEAVSVITQHDTDLINQLKTEKEAVQQKSEAIKTKKQQVESLKTDVNTKQQQLTSALDETNQFLTDIGQKEINLENQSSTLDAQTAKISAAISSWSQSQKPQSTAQQSSSQKSNSASASDENSNSNSNSNSGDNNNNSNSSSNSSPSASFSSVIGKAESALGKPYVMGAAGPDAFDCSGLVCWAYGISRATAQGLCNQCSKVSVSERQPGDLIFFAGTYNCGETVTHVGIYIGSNTMIDAEDGGVSEGSTESSYNLQHFYSYGRL